MQTGNEQSYDRTYELEKELKYRDGMMELLRKIYVPIPEEGPLDKLSNLKSVMREEEKGYINGFKEGVEYALKLKEKQCQ